MEDLSSNESFDKEVPEPPKSPPLPPRVPNPGSTIRKPEHGRGVSWNDQVIAKSPTSPVTSHMSKSPPTSVIGTNTLEHHRMMSSVGEGSIFDLSARASDFLSDVKSANPLESEAESLILKHIEQENLYHEPQLSLLDPIPLDSVHIFRNEQQEGNRSRLNTIDTAKSNLSKIQARHDERKANLTTEHQLANLTEALAGFHDQNKNDLREEPAEQAIPTSAGEELGRTATLLFRKQPSTRNARSNWNKLKTVVRATVPEVADESTDHKKTDGEDSCDVEAGSPMETTHRENSSDGMDPNATGTSKKKKKKQFLMNSTKVAQNQGRAFLSDFHAFICERRGNFINYLRYLFFLVLPAGIVSAVLFYFGANPTTGVVDWESSNSTTKVNFEGEVINPSKASASWWITFVFIRQALTFSIAILLQVFIVDFICLNTRFMRNMCGNVITLYIVLSKGWPFMAVAWASINFGVLHGDGKFAAHWLYWLEDVSIFTEANPSGSVCSSVWNTRTLAIAIIVGAVVALKRLWLGLYLGKKTYFNYANDLEKVVKKMVLLSEVASLARECQMETAGGRRSPEFKSLSEYGFTESDYAGALQSTRAMSDDSTRRESTRGDLLRGISSDADNAADFLHASQKMRLDELLGAWEDPDAGHREAADVSISAILQFRQSLSFLNTSYLFTLSWGDVSSRERMVISSQEVYKKLLLRSSQPDVLKFDVLVSIAKDEEGGLDPVKMKDLIRLLRPDRDGNLFLLDFVKSIDAVYKEAIMLRASVRNSEKIDKAFENVINVVFYVTMVCIILSQIGYDPLALFLSLSSLIVAFAFMIGSASAKMFEGWLFILIRRPYGIGDRIHVSSVECDLSLDGSLGWIVKDITLFYTVAVFAATGEQATMSNGSLANSRVLNMARSPNAQVYIHLKFSTDVKHDKIQVFDRALRDFVQARPRQWRSFNAFRATNIAIEQGYIGYVVVLQHREPWQSMPAICTSKAEVSAFCWELQKKLGMRYDNPTLPVDLTVLKKSDHSHESSSLLGASFDGNQSTEIRGVAALFGSTTKFST